MLNYLAVSNTNLDLNEVLAKLNNPKHGAMDIFIGKVRNINMDREVIGIEYEVFESLALKLMQELCNKVRVEISQELDIAIVHYKGHLSINGISIIIVVSSIHRKEAFNACRAIIEDVKHKLPIWKKEYYLDGNSDWVYGHSLCKHD